MGLFLGLHSNHQATKLPFQKPNKALTQLFILTARYVPVAHVPLGDTNRTIRSSRVREGKELKAILDRMTDPRKARMIVGKVANGQPHPLTIATARSRKSCRIATTLRLLQSNFTPGFEQPKNRANVSSSGRLSHFGSSCSTATVFEGKLT